MADLIMAVFYLVGGILSGGKPSDTAPRWEGGRNINENSKRPYWNSKYR